jgi:MYXO-CTERM domain-containing protein
MAMYDSGVDLGAPPDLASSTGSDASTNHAGDGSSGAVGDPCTDNSGCSSGICAKTSDSGYCTQSCDPSMTRSCPNGLSCGTIDGQNFCVQQSSGCDVGSNGAAPSLLALFWLALMALVVRRARRTV